MYKGEWNKTHGMSETKTYRSWQEMRYRCNNSNSSKHYMYGGRGVTVCEKWEKAPHVLRRIEAAKELSEAGYEVRIRIDPMVPIENWREHYLELLEIVFDKFIPERITLGSLRGLQSTINGCTDKTWVRYLKESSNWGKKIDLATRYAMYSLASKRVSTTSPRNAKTAPVAKEVNAIITIDWIPCSYICFNTSAILIFALATQDMTSKRKNSASPAPATKPPT